MDLCRPRIINAAEVRVWSKQQTVEVLFKINKTAFILGRLALIHGGEKTTFKLMVSDIRCFISSHHAFPERYIRDGDVLFVIAMSQVDFLFESHPGQLLFPLKKVLSWLVLFRL